MNDPEAYGKYCRELEGQLNKRFVLVGSSFPSRLADADGGLQMHNKSQDQKESRDTVAGIMAEQLGHDPRLTKTMTPEFALGCRRMTPGSGYLRSLTKENVEVINESVIQFTEDGLIDESGNEHKVEIVICATGFDVSFAPHFEVTGRNGANLRDQFGDFPKAYLGITVANFPNLFCDSRLCSMWRDN